MKSVVDVLVHFYHILNLPVNWKDLKYN